MADKPRRQAWGLLLLLAAAMVAVCLAPTAQAGRLEADFEWDLVAPSTADVINFHSTTRSERPIINCDWNAMVDGRLRWIRSQCEPSHRFERPGAYDITMVVTNDWGETNQTTKRVVIANQLPVAHLTFTPAAPTTDDFVTFTDASSDFDGTIATYRWEAQGKSGAASTFTHRFTSAGTHLVKLEVQDDSGGRDTAQLLVYVRPGLPAAADFTADPALPAPGQVVRFNDVSRPVAGDRAVAWTWRFADGFESQDRYLSRSFSEDGIYHVSLVVETEQGATLTIGRDIIVEEPAVVQSLDSAGTPFELAAPLGLLLAVALLFVGLGWRNRGH